MTIFNFNLKAFLSLLLISVLGACVTPNHKGEQVLNSEDNICVSKSGMVVTCGEVVVKHAPSKQEPDVEAALLNSHSLEAAPNSVMLGEYIEQISTDLLENMVVPVDKASVGITSFVEFSTTLSSINMLGTMLAEEFIFELQRNGIVVVDYKVQDNVEVKGTGDFIFSRNNRKLTLNGVMKYVLVGTLIYNKQGIWVNARIVDIESKKVVSTAKKLIPYFVLDNIVPFETEKQSFSRIN